MAKFLDFKKDGRDILVCSVKQGSCLGKITFYKPWKKWVFEPRPKTVFDEKCLRNIIATMAMERPE